jgi:hypothetical protein
MFGSLSLVFDKMKAPATNMIVLLGIFSLFSHSIRKVQGAVVTYQAEDADDLRNCRVLTKHTGFQGNGYVGPDGFGSYVSFDINALASSGDHEITIRYATKNSRPLDLLVDGSKKHTFPCSGTGDWANWNTGKILLPLNQGTRTLKLLASYESSGVNIDWLSVQSSDVDNDPPSGKTVYYEGENALSKKVIILKTHAGYRGSGYADFQDFGSHLLWVVDAPSTGNYEITARYASGNAREVDLILDGLKEGTFDFEGTGSWSNWKTETIVIPMKRGEHSLKLIAEQSIGPNIDWLSLRFCESTGAGPREPPALSLTEGPISSTSEPPVGGPTSFPESIVLSSNEGLERGQFVFSPNGKFKVGLTSAGDLVLQDDRSRTIWNAKVSGGFRCYMQDDGNVIVRQSNNNALWASNTSLNPDARLVVDDGGRIAVIHGITPLWVDGIPRGIAEGTIASPREPSLGGLTSFPESIVLSSNERLERGQFVFSPNGKFKVGLTSAGDLVLQDSRSSTIWKAKVSGGFRCYMQHDGNVIVRQHNNKALWATDTYNNADARLVVDDGGRIAVIHGNTPLWVDGIPRGQYDGPSSSDLSFPVRGVFYYPWYPETWTVNGKQAKFQPDLGFYSSSDPRVAEAHIDAFEYAHVDLSIASWWGPESNLDRARLTMLMDETIAMQSQVKWTIYYEDERDLRPSASVLKEDLDYLKKWFAWHPAWAHKNGRPVVFVYNEGGCEVVDRWMDGANGEWYVVLKLFAGFKECRTQPDHWVSHVCIRSPFLFSIRHSF